MSKKEELNPLEEFTLYEDMLLQIVRYHAHDIEIIIEFIPGDIRYRGIMTVCGKRYTTHGVNL